MPLSDGQVSSWVASSVCRGLASSKAELVRSPEGRSATLERGGDAVRYRGARRGGLERGGDYSVGSRGARMGRSIELGCGPWLLVTIECVGMAGAVGPARPIVFCVFKGDLVSGLGCP